MNKENIGLIKNLSFSYEIALAIGNSLNLREMIDHVLKTVVRKAGACRGNLWLWNGEIVEYLTGVGFQAGEADCRAVDDARDRRFKVVLEAGRPVVKTKDDNDFREFCVPFTGIEREVLLIPVEKLALIQLSFTYVIGSNKVLAGILAGVAPKLGNAILSCLNHEKLLAIERAKREHSETRYRDLVSNLDVGIYISTIKGEFLDANPAFLKMFGFKDQHSLFKYSWNALYANPDERKNFVQTITSKDRVKNWETLFRRSDGETFWAQVTAVLQPSQEDHTLKVMGIVEDISDRKRVEEKMQYLATHDSLTNIFNRYSLEEAINRTVAKSKRGLKSALLLIDLDNFKLVNDTLGHTAGDEMLITVTSILKRNLREGDLLARVGGDEFAVLLEGVSREEAMIVAEKLRRAVDNSELQLCIYKRHLRLSISIGIVIVEGEFDYQKLLSRADTALYAAKEEGGNKVVFVQPGHDEATMFSDANQIIALINRALKEDRFKLLFQPVVNLGDGKIIHHEVLVRLQGDDGEIISPHVFIPIAERFGLMPQIDRWVVQSSLTVLHKYPALILFVNLSGASLKDEALLEFMTETIKESGIEPSRIGFDISEATAIKDLVRAEHWIRRLKSMGCRFALDDFGIGFSYFFYLNILPVDYLKIDCSFVRNMDKEPAQRAVVRAMNAIAHTLGKETIAESVENTDVLKTLKTLETDYGQGYFLGKPAPFPEEQLSQWNP